MSTAENTPKTSCPDPILSAALENTPTIPSVIDKIVDILKYAEQGDAEAQYNLGVCYLHGYGVDTDVEQALTWLRFAAKQGFAPAQFKLGYCYLYVKGSNVDAEQAVTWLRAAAEQGDPEAKLLLGICYLAGAAVEEDIEQAMTWFREAAEQGFAPAQTLLGRCYLNGAGVSEDAKQAVTWLRAAAEQGDPEAKCLLGLCYLQGAGVEKDLEKAMTSLRVAAEHSHAWSQIILSESYLLDEGTFKEAEQAVTWLRDIALQNGTSSLLYSYTNPGLIDESETLLPQQLQMGLIDESNTPFATQIQALASDIRITALNLLGHAYEFGKGVARDPGQAVTFFRAAAELGDTHAQFRLGACYLEGKGVGQDAEQALKWFRSVIDHPSGCVNVASNVTTLPLSSGQFQTAQMMKSWAQLGFAFCCLTGKGIAKDENLGFSLLQQIADNIGGHAGLLLGLCYLEGTGTDVDFKQALAWFVKAAQEENFEAQLATAFLSAQIGPVNGITSDDWVIRLSVNSLVDLNYKAVDKEPELEWRKSYKNFFTFLRRKSETFAPAQVALARLIDGHYFDWLAASIDDMPNPAWLINQAAKQNDPAGLYYCALGHYEAGELEKSKECLSSIIGFLRTAKDPASYVGRTRLMTDLGGGLTNYPEGIKQRILSSAFDKLTSIHEIHLRKAEEDKRRAIEDLMSMFSHQFRGALGTILFNTEHENDRAVYAHTARSMSGLVEIAGVLSTSPESLQAGLAGDGAGQASPLSTLTSSIRDLIIDLTSLRNRDRLSPYYKAYAQRQGWVSPELKLTEWSQTASCQQYEQALQAQWDAASHALIHADIGDLQLWVEQHWLPLRIAGFAEDASSFSDYGPKASLLRIILTEILKNAIKHSDPNAAQPILLEWNRVEAGLSIRCTNHSTRATRMREKSKGSGRGLKILRMIASNLEGKFHDDLYSNPSSVCIQLPNWH